MQWYAMGNGYPLNVGGRPLHSWPSFIPVTFEMTILLAALCGVVALFFSMRLPRLNHPVFAVPGFERATNDRFFLEIRRSDPRFVPDRQAGSTRQFLHDLGAECVREVPQ